MKNSKYVENCDGVHIMGLAGGEYTLCGDAFDMFSSERDMGPKYEFKPTQKRIVTCPDCIEVIELCRGVKTK